MSGTPTLSTAEPVTSGRTGEVLTITLNRPEKLNAVTDQMSIRLCSLLKETGKDPAIRCVILRGAGKGFCAGQDLESTPAAEAPADLGAIVQRCYTPIITAITALPKPIIAAVHGVAAGAGANIALACDFVVASTAASFIQSFVHVGLIPDSAGTFFLPRTVGLARATALTMLGEKLPAQEAAAMGLIYKAAPPDEFESAVEQLAKRLAALPTLALGMTKRLLREGLASDLQAQLQAEAACQRTAGASKDFKEGIAAFLEKRPARFQGR